MNLKSICVLLIAFVMVFSVQAQKNIPPFKKGERAVFVGNSITHGGHYHSFIWLYYMTRFPNEPITIMNGGIGGDTAGDINQRLDEDVFNKNPTYMTMTFGMNDTGYYDFWKENAQELAQRQIKKSFESFQDIEKRMVKETGVTKVIICGSPYDQTSKIENKAFQTKNDALLKVNEFQQASAEKNGWGFVDFTRPMMEINQREQLKDSLFALCGGDRIHPDNDGHLVMAYLFLKAQGMAGKKVAEVSIDASTSKVEMNENCKISELNKNAEGLVFKYLASALPFPIDTVTRGWGSKKSQRDGLHLIPFTKEFNQEILKVKNLNSGEYQLLIDGQKITKVSAANLQMGINLAELTNTPQNQQATKIMILNEERFEIEKRFRDYAWMEFSFFQEKGLLFADNQVAMDSLRANMAKNIFLRGNFDNYSKAQYPEIRKIWQSQMDEIVKAIYAINKPVNHQFKLVKIQ